MKNNKRNAKKAYINIKYKLSDIYVSYNNCLGHLLIT